MYNFKRQKLSFTYSTICANFKLFESPIKTFKHSKGQSYTLYAEGNLEANIICPVKALWAYFQVRKPPSGPHFTYVTDQSWLSLNWCG